MAKCWGQTLLQETKQKIELLVGDSKEQQYLIGIYFALFLKLPWFIIVRVKDGNRVKRPRYAFLSYYIQLGCRPFGADIPKWNPLHLWLEWLLTAITLLSVRQIPRIGFRSPIRVIPEDLLHRLKDFLFAPFPDQPYSTAGIPVCSICAINPACSECYRCPDHLEVCCRFCGPEDHERCDQCDRCYTCHGGARICSECHDCSDCMDRFICERCNKCSYCVSPKKISELSGCCGNCLTRSRHRHSASSQVQQ
jgi:hypothetical protein